MLSFILNLAFTTYDSFSGLCSFAPLISRTMVEQMENWKDIIRSLHRLL